MILYGAPIREKIKNELIERVKKLSKKPVLAIVQVGNREDSNIYVEQKEKFGREIRIKVLINKFDENISEENLVGEIKKLNEDKNINGIVVQLPLPKQINSENILNFVSKKKDVDGLGAFSNVVPATARGVAALLDHYQISVKGKSAVVIGQSILAGKPIANELEKMGAKVLRCDIHTKNIPKISKDYDILVSATGKRGLITKEFVNEKQIVIDVGINRANGKLAGDVASNEVGPIVFAITPVPGGVGPLTVACLFQNLLDLDE